MEKSPKKIIKNTAKVVAVLWGLVLWWYYFSEKIWSIKHDVQKELTDSLWKKEILKDQETNDIIELMSGKISQEHFDALLARHGYTNDSLKVDTLISPDEALYNTILEMQTKYGNPKISFSGNFRNYETGENEPSRARFNPATNTIKAHQLDSVMIKFHNINKIEKLNRDHVWWFQWFNPDTRQQYLLNNRIAELAHAKQLQERWLIKWSIDRDIDYLRSWFDYDKTYGMPWTEEYQAHKEYEPALVQELIKTYKKYSGDASNSNLRTLAKFNCWFFENFKDEQQGYEYLQILEKRWDADADFFMGRLFFDAYETHFGSRVWYAVIAESDSNMTEIVFGKKYTAKILFKECLDYYKKSYTSGNLDAWYALVQIAFNFRWWENTDLVIEIGEDLLKNHINELETWQIKDIYMKLWDSYYHAWDQKKWAECFALSDKYGWWEDPWWY